MPLSPKVAAVSPTLFPTLPPTERTTPHRRDGPYQQLTTRSPRNTHSSCKSELRQPPSLPGHPGMAGAPQPCPLHVSLPLTRSLPG